MWKRKIITITAGTPIRVHEADSKADAPQATALIVQMLVASGGDLGYLILGVPIDHTPATSEGAIQLAKATSTVPGLPFVYQVQDIHSGERIDMNEVAIDGAHNGDTVLVMWWEIIK